MVVHGRAWSGLVGHVQSSKRSESRDLHIPTVHLAAWQIAERWAEGLHVVLSRPVMQLCQETDAVVVSAGACKRRGRGARVARKTRAARVEDLLACGGSLKGQRRTVSHQRGKGLECLKNHGSVVVKSKKHVLRQGSVMSGGSHPDWWCSVRRQHDSLPPPPHRDDGPCS